MYNNSTVQKQQITVQSIVYIKYHFSLSTSMCYLPFLWNYLWTKKQFPYRN